MSKFKHYSQSQSQLLPPNLSDSIEPDHIARLINQVIDDMDLSFIEDTYSDDGQKAYHPKMLFKVLVYGYTIGLRSSRKLADKLSEDVVFMWLAGRQSPDFRTISDFRKNKLGDVKKAFVSVLSLCRELGMVRIGKVCIDGTKFRADASGNKMQYRKTLVKRRSRIEEQVDDILEEADAIDREEEKLLGDNTEHHTGIDIAEVRKKLGQMNRRRHTIKRKRDKLEAKKTDINARLRKMRRDRNSMGSTDKDATLMLMKENYIAPGYNAQFATEHQVILAYNATSDRNDQKQLKPMVKEVEENTGKKPDIIPADAGYGTKANYRYLKNARIAAFIPYNNFNKEMAERNHGIYELPKKIDVELERYKFRQRLRLLSPEGKKMMERRREDVEPVIGDIKRNMNFRTFHLRGKPKCLIELGLVSIGHNLKKIKNHLEKLAKWDDGNQKGQELGMVLGYRPA
jgi:transposase